jgi:hypothetical protein
VSRLHLHIVPRRHRLPIIESLQIFHNQIAHPYIQDVRQRLFQILRTSMLRCVQTAFLLPQFCPNQTKTKLDVEGGRRRAITPKRFNPISPSKNNIAAQLPRVISNKTIKCTLPPFSVCFHKTFCHLSSSTG